MRAASCAGPAIQLPTVLLANAEANEEAVAIIRTTLSEPSITAKFADAAVITGEPLGGGRSGALVLKLSTPADAAIVLKISARPDGEAERASYERFARLMLPVETRPGLLAFVERRTLAGLSFEWVGGADRTPESFTGRLQAGEGQVLDRFIRELLPDLARSWYGASWRMSRPDLAQRYREHYFSKGPGIPGNERTMRRIAARLLDATCEGPTCRVGGERFRMPSATLFEVPPRRYLSCIVHGDLNTDNLLIAEAERGIRLIDFRKTGRGHVFEDVVALEHSVRINYPPDVSIDRLLHVEADIAGVRPGTDTPPYAACIVGLRRAAMALFGEAESFSNYHHAVAAIGLRLMQAEDLTDVAQARIVASVLWATRAVAESAAN